MEFMIVLLIAVILVASGCVLGVWIERKSMWRRRQAEADEMGEWRP